MNLSSFHDYMYICSVTKSLLPKTDILISVNLNDGSYMYFSETGTAMKTGVIPRPNQYK